MQRRCRSSLKYVFFVVQWQVWGFICWCRKSFCMRLSLGNLVQSILCVCTCTLRNCNLRFQESENQMPSSISRGVAGIRASWTWNPLNFWHNMSHLVFHFQDKTTLSSWTSLWRKKKTVVCERNNAECIPLFCPITLMQSKIPVFFVVAKAWANDELKVQNYY